MPDEIRRGLPETGLMGLTIPEEYGGAGADTRTIVRALEEIAAESAAVATLLAVHLSVAAAPIVDWGSAEQKRTFLPPMAAGTTLGAFALSEPGVGSDAASLACAYVRDGSGYRLRGTKMFVTNAASAGVVLVFATRDPSLGHRGISAFLVPREARGLSVAQKLDKLGIRGSETSELVLDEVPVGPDALLATEGSGFTVALQALTGGRLGIAACALGVARAAYEELRAGVTAVPTDGRKAEVARAYTDLLAARALVERAAAQKDRGEPFAEGASAAKLFASQVAVRLASRAIDLGGPGAARAGARTERLLRDARVFPIVEGTTEIQELILGRELVGR